MTFSFLFELVIINQNMDLLVKCSTSQIMYLVSLKSAPFLQSTADSHSDLPSSDQKPSDSPAL